MKFEELTPTLDGLCMGIQNLICNNDVDWCQVITGTERGGKSTLGFRMCWQVAPSKDFLNNIIYTPEDFKRVLPTIKEKNQAVMIDEGALAAFSRDAMKTENRDLIQAVTVLGHHNAFICINITSMRLLDTYLRLDRLRAVAKIDLEFVPDSMNLKRGKVLLYSKYNAERIGKDNYGRLQFPKDANFVFYYDKITEADGELFDLWREYELISQKVKRETEKGEGKNKFQQVLAEVRANPEKFITIDAKNRKKISKSKLIEAGLGNTIAINAKGILEEELHIN